MLLYCGKEIELASEVVNDRNGTLATQLHERLTPREQEVLLLIADGLSSKEIATRLGISFKTAVSHRSRILEKFGVHNVVAVLRHAVRSGLIKP